MRRSEFLKLCTAACTIPVIGLPKKFEYTYFMGEGCSPNTIYLWETPDHLLDRLFDAPVQVEVRPVFDAKPQPVWEYLPGQYLAQEPYIPTHVFELVPGLWIHSIITPDERRIDAYNQVPTVLIPWERTKLHG